MRDTIQPDRHQPGHRLEHCVHLSLLAGVGCSAVLLIAGMVRVIVNGTPWAGGPPPSLLELFRQTEQGRGRALLNLGLLLLTLTPVFRVAVIGVGSLLAGDYRFAAVAGIVLILLGISLVLGVG